MEFNKDTFCIMTHKGFFVQPDRKVKPCCIFTDFDEPVIFDESKTFDEMYNSPQFIDLRQKMDNGIIHKGCDACFTGKSTMREGNNTYLFENNYNLLKNIIPKDKTSTEIHYLDLRLSNLCNFKCRMCNETYSSSWAQELDRLEIKYNKPNHPPLSDDYLSKLYDKISNLKYLYLGGGEPFIMKETFELLNLLSDDHKKNITLALNTNLSTLKYKNVDILEELGKFRQVYFNISCDGVYQIGEYQRTGFNTDKFNLNVKELLQRKNKYDTFNIYFTYALGAVNIFHLPEFLDYIEDNFGLNHNHVGLEFIEFPWYYNIGNATKKFKNRVKSFILDITQQYPKSELASRLLTYSEFISREFDIPEQKTLDRQINKYKKVDRFRKENILNIAPWVVDEIMLPKSNKNLV